MNNKKQSYILKLSRRSPAKSLRRLQSPKLLTILITGLIGALIGGMLSVGLVFSVYGHRINPSASLPPIIAEQAPKAYRINQTGSLYPVVDIANNVSPAVVLITNYQSANYRGYFYGNNNTPDQENSLVEAGSGSGFIIDAEKGYIVTNNHVIEGAKRLSVSLTNGKTRDATVIGADPRTDLAVIKISADSELSAVILGDSQKLQVGEPVVAIGNPGGAEFAGSVTGGFVSAKNRVLNIQGEYSFDLIQTDAAINPGNSGGPLVNYLGQVIGINSAKFNQQGFEGIGFAIPITDAIPVLNQLIENGYATHAGLNVQIANQYTKGYAALKGTTPGAYIVKVIPGGPAGKAGLLPGDILTKINDATLSDAAGLTHELFKYRPGDSVRLTYSRNGTLKEVLVELTAIKG